VEVDINSAWEIIREDIKLSAKESLGYYEQKKLKPWFNKGCSKSIDQRKQAELQQLQDANKINRDNWNNIRCEASKHLKGKSGNI
jgi:hypothetical protein